MDKIPEIYQLAKRLWAKTLIRDTLLMIFFSSLSILFGLIQFKIPGVEGAISDLREIPLLASVFYLSNPLFTIGISAITSFTTPPEGSYFSTLIMHSIPLIVSWFLYNYLKKKNITTTLFGIIWLGYTIIYYTLLLIPLFVGTNFLFGLNLERNFVSFYLELVKTLRFEIITTSIVMSLFLVQLKYRMALKRHLDELENIVKERTRELSSTIEELKKAQQHLIQAEKMASLGTLSSGIAHEINNPLNFIQGGLLMLEDLKEQIIKDASVDERKECEKAQYIMNEGLDRAKSIVESLMMFTSREPARITKTDLHEIIDNTLLFINHKKPANVVIEKDYKLTKQIPLYRDKMHQILTYIIDNAFFELNKYPHKQGLITISTDEGNKYAFLSISNNGDPIPEARINQIFDPFFTTKDPGMGVGLGLSIVYSLVNEHKGQIRVENTEDGVSFIIQIPLSEEKE